jgi:flavin reductase (DIM6/NTAB) family NADH-FMN oxidoreductase RutF
MVTTSPEGTKPSAVDAMEFRRALGHFATGVTVVTYQSKDADQYENPHRPENTGQQENTSGAFRGATVNSFTSVSLDPPLVLVSLGKKTRCAEALRPGRPFAVNVLQHGQRDLAMQFAGRQPEARPVAKDAIVLARLRPLPPGASPPYPAA